MWARCHLLCFSQPVVCHCTQAGHQPAAITTQVKHGMRKLFSVIIKVIKTSFNLMIALVFDMCSMDVHKLKYGIINCSVFFLGTCPTS